MHGLSMPSQIRQVALIFQSGRTTNKAEERGVKYHAIRSSNSDDVQTVRSKYRTNPGLGKFGSSCLLRIALIRFLSIFKVYKLKCQIKRFTTEQHAALQFNQTQSYGCCFVLFMTSDEDQLDNHLNYYFVSSHYSFVLFETQKKKHLRSGQTVKVWNQARQG